MRSLLLITLSLAACGDDKRAGIDASTQRDSSVDTTPIDAPGPRIVIDEVFVNRGGGGNGTEFVEIGAPAGTVLDGLSIRIIAANGTETGTYTLSDTAGTMVGATNTWVVGGGTAAGRVDRIVLAGAGWGLDNASGAVQLLRTTTTPPTLVDVVGYGAAVTAAGSLTAPTATVEGTFVPNPAANTSSMARKAAAADTNNNATDFCAQAQSGGAANAATCL